MVSDDTGIVLDILSIGSWATDEYEELRMRILAVVWVRVANVIVAQMPSMDDLALAERVRELTVVGKVCSESEIKETQQIVRAIKVFLRQDAARLLAEHRHAPVMVWYLCDGWAGLVKQRTTASSGTHT